MNYELHPIVVHFPIALLTVYSLLRILPVSRWFTGISWKSVRLVPLVVGLVGVVMALGTGEAAQSLVHPNHDVVEMHEFFAQLATILYAVCAVIELLPEVLSWQWVMRIVPAKVSTGLLRIVGWFARPLVVGFIALLAFVALLVTGVLGGVMVYGTSADPLAQPILNLLGIII